MSDAETARVTYIELSRARGITVAAARRLTQRHKWPKQIGNDGFTRVVVPMSMLAAWDGDACDDGKANAYVDARDDAPVNGGFDRADTHVNVYDDTTESGASALDPATVRAIADATADAWADLADDATSDIRRAVRALEETVVSLREQLATERLLRAEDKERADHAEGRAQAADSRVRELTEQLAAELVEHRRVVGLLTEQLAARRSWWPWRRRA